LPTGANVDVVFVELTDGRIVPRHPDELILRPTPPVVNQGG